MTLLTPELLDTKTYGFEKLRYLLQSLDVQEGVVDANDLKVVQRGAGANMSVDVGAGRCFVQADTGTRNGLYHEVNDATVNVAIGASHASFPRVDQIVIEVRDTSDMGSAADDAIFRVIAGTATSGATLDNAYTTGGAAALPNNCIRLADVLVPAASTSVITANIRDRRKWARGFRFGFRRTSGDIIPAAAFSSVTSNFTIRAELSGVPFVVEMHGEATATAAQTVSSRLLLDGVGIAQFDYPLAAAGFVQPNIFYEDPAPTLGTHTIDPQIRMPTGGTPTLYSNAVQPLFFSVREDVRQSASN